MAGWRDRVEKLRGRTRFVVLRVMLHLSGEDAPPQLGVFNRVAQSAIEAEGDLQVMGEGLVEICESLLRTPSSWQSVANEGDVFWDEGEASDYVNELFTDSAQRYLSDTVADNGDEEDETLSLPISRNVVLMLTVAYTGEMESLETDLSDIEVLENAFKDLINLHYNDRLRAIQIHFSPAHFGDELTNDQVIENFPELVPL
ncbi:DUF1517 domain-containing protein [Dactylococcopsis salina]|uniref:DUF1517 domain-containing protein n=1 Tax=Dactylococcopsis salina (strain PCC 8305) TaxID=13035 RepID=K9YS91_DACS8|nr:DUF1517 domain-containing protein [Dactylococcopsis salina]AFZ49811.1 Protein of unknown function (DUF1517) [Dactylococcopsis salina PCC 8305]